MIKLRNNVFILALIILTISFIGCKNSSSTFSGSKTGNYNQFLVDFDVLNTSVNNDMPLSNGDNIDTTIDIEKGNVDVLVKNENDTIFYQGDDVENGNFTLSITESGKYTFYITGHKAKGSVHFVKSPSNDITTIPSDRTEPSITNTPTVTQSTVQADNSLLDSSPILMPTPPFSYYVSDTIVEKESTPILLNMTSCEPNEITDIDKWFNDKDLSICRNLDSIKDASSDIYFYKFDGADGFEGNILNIYNATQDKLLYSIDFSNYIYSPKYKEKDYEYIQQKINWATIEDGVLYVAHSHNTYAESSNNMNAYITAIDLSDMSVLWRSDALVCNSKDFLIVDNVIISGYGFTDEPDYLYQIDRNTGKTLDKTLLKTAPEYIIKKDSILYVRTYNTDYQFRIE